MLIYFEKLYGVMNEAERRQLIEALISEIQIYPERQPNGQWLKSIKFKLPIIEEDMSISLDNEEQVEPVSFRDSCFEVVFLKAFRIEDIIKIFVFPDAEGQIRDDQQALHF